VVFSEQSVQTSALLSPSLQNAS